MPNAARILIVALGAAAVAACQQHPQPTDNQDLSIEGSLAAGQLPANADIETLPPDESSETSSGELNAGDDNPDVNNLNTSSNSP